MILRPKYGMLPFISTRRGFSCCLVGFRTHHSLLIADSGYGYWCVVYQLKSLGRARGISSKDGMPGDEIPVRFISREEQVTATFGSFARRITQVASSPTVVSTDLLGLPDDLNNVCFVVKRAYCSHGFRFEALMRG